MKNGKQRKKKKFVEKKKVGDVSKREIWLLVSKNQECVKKKEMEPRSGFIIVRVKSPWPLD